MAAATLQLQTCHFDLTGVTPLLMHNEVLANPMAPEAKRLKALTAKRKKTDDDIEAISRAEFDGGLYIDRDGPFVPDHWVLACLRDAGKTMRLGRDVTRGILIEVPGFPLRLSKAYKTADELWNAGYFDRRMVGNQKVRVLRTRPRFDVWGIAISVTFDTSVFDERQIEDLLHVGGQKIGLGDYRPRFGRFTVEAA